MNNHAPDFIYAGFWLRFWAFLLDTLLVRALLGIVNPPYAHYWHLPLLLLYFFLMTKLNHGQTLGKMVFGLRVVSHDQSPLSWQAVLFRELICRYIIEALPISWLLYAVAAFTPKKKGLMDLVSDTYVVKVEPYLHVFQVEEAVEANDWLFP